MIKSKSTAPLIERAWDFVKGGVYGIKKRSSKSLRDKLLYHEEETRFYEKRQKNLRANITKHRPRIKKSELQKRLNENKFYTSYEYSKKEHIAKAKEIRTQKTKVDESIAIDTSSRAALDRLQNPNFTYESLRELIVDRALVERFAPKGQSSFDLIIDISKVSTIENPEEVSAILAQAEEQGLSFASGLDQNTIEILLAFGNARILGKKETIEDEQVSLGDSLTETVSIMKTNNLDQAKQEVNCGNDMESFIETDKELTSLLKISTIMRDSANTYFDSMMQTFDNAQ